MTIIKTCDVGRMPFPGNFKKFIKGAQHIDPLMELLRVNKTLRNENISRIKSFRIILIKLRLV